jgi:hypothetical protein
MKKNLVVTPFLFYLLFACSSKKKATVAEVAPEMCSCFSHLEKAIVMKSLIIGLAESDNPDKQLKQDFENQRIGGNPEFIESDINRLSKAEDENTPTGACLKNMEEKYNGSFDFKSEAQGLKLIDELKKQQCLFAAGMLNWKWKR